LVDSGDAARVQGPRWPGYGPPIDLSVMEAFLIVLMALVVVLTGFVALVVLYKLLKADNS